MDLRTAVQEALTRVGERCSVNHIRALSSVANYLEVGRWLKAGGFARKPRYRDREDLYAAVVDGIANERVLYLEFGVHRGASMRVWSRLLRHPEAELHGFDSFEGLPERWDALRPRGTFDVRGAVPTFDDGRVTIHKGWFDKTLPAFAWPSYDRLVVNLDADLYSSTKFVLDTIRDRIRPGTILMFDEFCDRQHELRAFDELLEHTRMRFEVRGATRNLEHVVFERVS